MSFRELIKDAPEQNSLLLGEPNSIRPALSVKFEATVGQNLLIVGQKEEASLATSAAAISSLALNLRNQKATFHIFDGSSAENPREDYFKDLSSPISDSCKISSPSQAVNDVAQLHAELQKRISGEPGEAYFVFIHGLQRFRKLKQEDSFSWNDDEKSPGAQLNELITQGPEYKIHFVIWCDSWNNFLRICPRKTLNEFEYRILFQMGQNDSVNLIDSAAASKLELHTALLYNEQSGDTLKFRPFALPNKQWLSTLTNTLKN